MKKLIKISLVLLSFLISHSNLHAQTIFDAVKAGKLENVKSFIENNSQLLQLKDEAGNTPLHVAIADKKNDIAVYLINNGSDVNSKSSKGETPLHNAATIGSVEIVNLLISKGTSVDVLDESNYTPLTNAVRAGSLEVIKTLIENKANINMRGMWNWLPIQLAAEFSSAEIVNYLIDKGADIPFQHGEEAYQILNASCSKGLTKLFEKLLEKGFDLKVNRDTSNLIHLAAAGGSVKIVDLLLEKGFKVMTGDAYGWSPLHSAAEKGNLKIVELLIEKGADINDRNASGRTPYNLAEYFGNKEVCDYLISKGADKSEQQFPIMDGKYLGQKEPGNNPKVFAPDIITTKYAMHGNVSFTTNGEEAFWSGWYPSKNSTEEVSQILTMKLENGKWTKPEIASFSKIGFNDDSPFVTPDGNKIFFVSKRPLKEGNKNAEKENIWFVTREGNKWSNPTPLDIVNNQDLHWQVSTDNNGNLYFGARDPEGKNFGEIFYSKFVNGIYLKPEKLGASINSENSEGSPYISPEGSYLLFDRATKQGQQMGIFISFLKSDGTWTEAKSITADAKINPVSQCCNVTKDGKYFFYISWYGSEWASFWVNTSYIEEMRAKEVK